MLIFKKIETRLVPFGVRVSLNSMPISPHMACLSVTNGTGDQVSMI